MHINFDHPRSPTSQKPSCLLVTRSVRLQCKVAATTLRRSTSTLVPYLPSLHVSLSPCSSVSFSHVTLQLTYHATDMLSITRKPSVLENNLPFG
jgi:hypothetical protein